MSATLDDALARIALLFGGTSEPAPDSLSDADYLTLLSTIQTEDIAALTTQKPAVPKFLYFGCQRFDRWSPPSPFVVPDSYSQSFNAFLIALVAAAQGPLAINTLMPRLHAVRTRLFDNFAYVYGRPAQAQRANRSTLLDELEALPWPIDMKRRNDFLRERSDTLSVLHSIEANSIGTRLRTSMPYAWSPSDLKGTARWRDIEVSFTLTVSESGSPEGFTASPGAALQSMSASRWQYATTSVDLYFHGLIDCAAWTPARQHLEGGPSELEHGWPNCYTVAFELLYDLYWRVCPVDRVGASWAPAPRDLASVQCSYETAEQTNIWCSQRSLGGWQLSIPEAQVTRCDLGVLDRPTSWHRCESQAQAYLSLGDTDEALLLLNIAVEALLDERLGEFASAQEDPQTAMRELTAGKLLFAEAEEVVAAQYPDLRGKVQWPERSMQPSRYAQIKWACQLFNLRCSKIDAVRHYSKVSRKRNDLVHGRQADRVPVATVTDALVGLQWLVDNFVLGE